MRLSRLADVLLGLTAEARYKLEKASQVCEESQPINEHILYSMQVDAELLAGS